MYILSKRFAHKFLRLCEGFFSFSLSLFYLFDLFSSSSYVLFFSHWYIGAHHESRERANVSTIKNQVKNEREKREHTKKNVLAHVSFYITEATKNAYIQIFLFHIFYVALRTLCVSFFFRTFFNQSVGT